ncbi:MAG TPA: lipoate--protein ligase family protein [Pirellulales bacterium]|nr:lipoate--protein ligase family protein [Pirellulales bacterium]
MELLELTLDTPEENLALDEALLLSAEAAGEPRETLRLWEPREPFVVLGSSSRIAEEVQLDECQVRGVKVVRRTSGGAAIVTGPGCLMYSLVLSLDERPELRSIDRAHCFVLNHVARAIGGLAPGVGIRGTSDLAIGNRKFSGNSLRMKSRHLLYHGTLLYRFPLDLIEACLARPPREPAYRAARSHDEFITNLPLQSLALRLALVDAFHPTPSSADWPREMTAQLAAEKFASEDWTTRL